jgi:peptidoglycan-associated lipoprotein
MSRRHLLSIVMCSLLVVMLAACGGQKAEEVAVDPEPMDEPPMEEPMVDEEPMENQDMEPEPTAIPVLEDVFFAFDKSDLTSDAKRKLENNARQLKDARNVSITIEGHCDERGTSAYNLALGERRAKAAASFLTSLGVSSSRIKTVSYGEERPFATGSNEAAWSKNRRAHFVAASK